LLLKTVLEQGDGLLELVPAARVTETDNLPLVERQRIGADRLAGPLFVLQRTDFVHAIFEMKSVR